MRRRRHRRLLQVGSTLALVLALAGCTKGGQFDPTTLFDDDMFGTKKPLKGERELVFPSGVPGTSTGVPPELVKGYQPPPEQAADNGDAAGTAGAAAPPPRAEVPKPKPKSKPKPKLARVRASPPPTRINIGLAPRPAAPAQPQAQPSQSIWPAPPSTAPSQNTAPSQSIWPNPPASGTASQ